MIMERKIEMKTEMKNGIKKKRKEKKKASISIFENGLKCEWNGRGKLLYTLIGKERETERSRERERERKKGEVNC